MEQTLSFVLTLTIAWMISFYAARLCLRGVVLLINRSAPRSAVHHRENAVLAV